MKYLKLKRDINIKKCKVNLALFITVEDVVILICFSYAIVCITIYLKGTKVVGISVLVV